MAGAATRLEHSIPGRRCVACLRGQDSSADTARGFTPLAERSPARVCDPGAFEPSHWDTGLGGQGTRSVRSSLHVYKGTTRVRDEFRGGALRAYVSASDARARTVALWSRSGEDVQNSSLVTIPSGSWLYWHDPSSRWGIGVLRGVCIGRRLEIGSRSARAASGQICLGPTITRYRRREATGREPNRSTETWPRFIR